MNAEPAQWLRNCDGYVGVYNTRAQNKRRCVGTPKVAPRTRVWLALGHSLRCSASDRNRVAFDQIPQLLVLFNRFEGFLNCATFVVSV